jgi:hypothetical protein
MSNRFGRNQKRAMREQIEFHAKTASNLSDALLMQQGLTAYQRQKIETMEGALDDVAKELGQYFYGLPPVKLRVDEYRDRFRLPAPIPASELMFRDSDQISHLVSQAAHELSFVRAGIERDRFTGSVHVQLETPDGKRFYAISASAWENMRKDRQRLNQQILPMIAREMAEFIAGGER